jgi:hypothetical protein
MSGFFFCGITLDGEVNSSDSSKKENSEVDQIEKSFEILLKFVINIALAAIYSIAKSLVVVASIEFSTMPLNIVVMQTCWQRVKGSLASKVLL